MSGEKMDMREMAGMIDMAALEDATGIKGLGMIEAAKAYDLKLDYLTRQINCIFEFAANLNTRFFGVDDREKDNAGNPKKRGTGDVIKKHFPKGRAYYQTAIVEAEAAAYAYAEKQKAALVEMTAKTFDKIKEKQKSEAPAPAPAPAAPETKPGV